MSQLSLRLPLRRLLGTLLLCVATLSLSAQAQQPTPQTMIPAPPQLAASSWILMDANSGEVLVEHNADERLPPASLTKLMTAYLVERELDQGNIAMEDPVTISERAWRTGGSKMFVEVGTQVSIHDLLYGIIIQSGNDASVAVAEHLAGGERPFADLMNQHATRLGMHNTNFVNATGLPDADHYSSARDMALLSRYIINDYPEHYAVYSERYFTYNGIRQPNRNRLLWRDPSVDGLKTGHTSEAGYCLVASAERDGMRLISVVMGTASEEARAQETQKLLSYGFRYYETLKVYEEDEVVATPRIWGGEVDELSLGVDGALWATVPRARNEGLNARLSLPDAINAPVAAGERVGTLQVVLGDEVVAERPLVALEPVEQGGLFKRLLDAIRQFISGFFS
ncbi:D-alanyl-D-alanine carboxypeptidase family protein [Halomonas sp. 328]|uniref:D-alanyl-D-alanine carboxypeptidase family protein n=1 Tax=Halomonas sp. 328 TaxID=2776704 RepID=UPI0018A75B40|nr:D-alanyl-D-alanine carboxypeptidase family protein [Halomonas sp. 328]MBF8221291.1 D-alanyl-D-alanine carboxypeptidase [Halomonas sp. 328]